MTADRPRNARAQLKALGERPACGSRTARAPRPAGVSRPGRPAARARRGLTVLTALASALALLSACASMPDSGDVASVESSPRPDAQVRVFAVPPPEGAGPWEVVQGFLEALTSDDPDYEIARKYLTDEASHRWDPTSSTTVLADGPRTSTDRGNSNDDEGRTFTLTGRTVAGVDAQHAYTPRSRDWSDYVHVAQTDRTGGEWRIDRVPPGIVLGESDFQRIYSSVNKYYYAADSGGRSGQERLVSDPVYVRERIDPVTQAVRSLLAGPTRWLAPAVRTVFPNGTRLAAGTRNLTLDDRDILRVPLDGHADDVRERNCELMAAQVLFTLQDLAPSTMEGVELHGSDGRLCGVDEERARSLASGSPDSQAPAQYFLDDRHELVRFDGSGEGREPEPVPGALGDGTRKLRSVAVSRPGERAAAVGLDGKFLWTSSLVQGAELGDALLTSKAESEDDRLTTPSWDGRGDLWVADRDPRDPALYVLPGGTGSPVRVDIPQLADDERVSAVRAAADAVHLALLVERDGRRELRIGRIGRTDASDGSTVVTVTGLRPGAPQMEDVRAFSWAGGSRLVVVGREQGGVQQIRYVQSDGSAPASGVLPGLTGVRAITAAENDRLPILAHSDDGIVRLPPGAPWQTVYMEGSAPVYPG